MKTKALCFLLAIISAISASSQTIEQDGIEYRVISGTNVEVASSDLSGIIDIPSKVIYDGKTYTVTVIGYGAFDVCSDITSVTIPNTVTEIASQAFAYCRGLTSLTIPNSVFEIGAGAFGFCTNLSSVAIPDSVFKIGALAFYDCTGLKSVTIPNSVTVIGEDAFYNCSGLNSIKVEHAVPLDIDAASVFKGVPISTCVLYVPEQSKALYAESEQWGIFKNIETF